MRCVTCRETVDGCAHFPGQKLAKLFESMNVSQQFPSRVWITRDTVEISVLSLNQRNPRKCMSVGPTERSGGTQAKERAETERSPTGTETVTRLLSFRRHAFVIARDENRLLKNLLGGHVPLSLCLEKRTTETETTTYLAAMNVVFFVLFWFFEILLQDS